MKIEQTVIDSIRSRPRFKIFTNVSSEEYAAHLKQYLAENADSFSGNINAETATIKVKTEEDNYWKPNLALRTEMDPDHKQTVIRGIFGPSSAVWTFFMFLYFTLAILWMVFVTLWFVEKQISSNEFPWAPAASVITASLLILTYAAAKFGQMKAKTEMKKLREFAEDSIGRLEKN